MSPWPKGKRHTKEEKQQIKSSAISFWRRPEARKLMSRIKLAQYRKNPKLKQEIEKIITKWHRDNPNIRKRVSKKIKQFFIKNPDAFGEFLKHGKNPLKRHLRTSQGFLVRSKGEKQIANFLCSKNIPCLYESIPLLIARKPYKGNICTPDFYIPQWNIFIEFYGGYPKSWKKKVLKNKIYKTHMIPVLGITPSELENLDYYLLKDAMKLSNSSIARNFKIYKWLRV